MLPIAYVTEALARVCRFHEPLLTVDGVRLSKKKMFFSDEKARKELGYLPGPACEGLREAVEWFRQHGYVR